MSVIVPLREVYANALIFSMQNFSAVGTSELNKETMSDF